MMPHCQRVVACPVSLKSKKVSLCLFGQKQRIVISAMNTNTRQSNAEEHRLLVETCFTGTARVIEATSKPLIALVIGLGLATGQPIQLLHFLRSLF
jgi:hypothetical protein